ncbi:MAG TPA: FtsX-like permease family protein, partial [Anaerolineaceae bacterium]|nr:FtsX-like permease family protein [Anaerolineaceae bacterium]
REITILRACGFTSHNIRALILLRTLLQLLAAYLFGYGLTALVLSVLNKINPLTLHSIPLPVIITGKLFLSGLLLATLFGLAGVWMSTMHLENKSVAQLINK